MPTSLSDARVKLVSRVNLLDSAFDRQIASPHLGRRVDRFASQEGLISSLWQTWCQFCRTVILASASGGAMLNGAQIISPYAGRSEQAVAGVAKALASGKAAGSGKPVTFMRQEPTWGACDKLVLIAVGLQMSNSNQLATSFGAPLSLLDLQLCRNASAHVNVEILREVSAARVRYSDTKYQHPSDLMRWTVPSTSDFLWKTWVADIVDTALTATT